MPRWLGRIALIPVLSLAIIDSSASWSAPTMGDRAPLIAQTTDPPPSDANGQPAAPPSPIWLWLFLILIPAGWIGLAIWRWQQDKAAAERDRSNAPPSNAQIATNRAGTVITADRRQRRSLPAATGRFSAGHHTASELADVDADLPPLPERYNDGRIVLLPGNSQWAYVYWDISHDDKQAARQQGGVRLALRLSDVTDIELDHHPPHALQQYDCDELAREWYLPIPVSDRNYLVEMGYLTASGGWIRLARSQSVRIPPAYPSAWSFDQFLTIDWNTDLKSHMAQLQPFASTQPPIHQQLFELSHGRDDRTGLSSWAYGVGISAPVERSRQFWLMADAELIVYGVTESDATLWVDGRPAPLAPDGTFRFHISFQDGELHYPIRAIAADGEQARSIRMDFARDTPSRSNHTN